MRPAPSRMARAAVIAAAALLAWVDAAGAAPLVKYFPAATTGLAAPADVAVTADGAIWAQRSDGFLTRVNPTTGAATAAFPVSGPGGGNAGLAPSGTAVWVAAPAEAAAVRVSATGAAFARSAPQRGLLSALSPASDGGLWAASDAPSPGQLVRLTASGAASPGFPLAPGFAPEPARTSTISDTAASPDGGAWFVVASDDPTAPHGRLGHAGASGGALDVDRAISGYRPIVVEAAPGGGAWVVGSGTVDRFDATGTRLGGYPKPAPVGSDVRSAVDRDGNLWVDGAAGSAPALWRYAASTGAQDQAAVLDGAGAARATGIAVDASGDPWVGLDGGSLSGPSLAHVFASGVDTSQPWSDSSGLAGQSGQAGGNTDAHPAAPPPPTPPPGPLTLDVGSWGDIAYFKLARLRGLDVWVRASGPARITVRLLIPASTARALRLRVPRRARLVVLAQDQVVARKADDVLAQPVFGRAVARRIGAKKRHFPLTIEATAGAARSSEILDVETKE